MSRVEYPKWGSIDIQTIKPFSNEEREKYGQCPPSPGREWTQREKEYFLWSMAPWMQPQIHDWRH